MSATILQLPASKRITPPLKPSEDPEAKEKAARRSYRENLLHEAKARATASDDPIFGAIVSHLDAVVAKYTHSDDASEMSFEEEQADEPYSNELDERCGDTLKVVLSTAPTTMAGVVALLEHVALHEFLYPVRPAGDETFLSSYNEYCGKWKRFGQDFPLRLAETIRSLIGSAPSAA
jgi:hypothetical protein